MASKQYEIVLTMNGKQVEDYLKRLKERAKAVNNEMEAIPLEKRADDEKFLALQNELKILEDVIQKGKSEMLDYSKVVENLAGSKLYKLRRALRQVKADMGKASEDSGEMDGLRDAYQKITQQIRRMGEEWVNVSKVMENVSDASEKDLRKALAQTKELHAATKRNNAEYKDQADIIRRLEQELDKISGKTVDHDKIVGNLSGSSVKEIKAAIDQMERLQQETKAGGAEWLSYADKIKMAKFHLDTLTTEHFDFGSVMKNLGDASYKDVKSAIAEMERLRNEAKMGGPIWKSLDGQIKEAKKHLAEFVDEGQKMSLQTAKDIGNGIGIDDKSIDELKEAVKVLEKAKGALKPSDKRGLKELDQQIETINKHLNETSDQFDYVSKVMNDLSGASLDDLKKAAQQLEKEMSSLNRNTREFHEKHKNLAKIKQQIDSVNDSYKKQDGAIKQVMKRLTAYVLIYTGFNLIKDKIFEVVRMNLSLSDSLADIRKTTGLANDEVEALADNLLELDTRTAADNLNQLAYEAGRMGVGKFGAEGVEGFVKAANKIGVALGEDLGDDAIAQVYKLADVMGIIPRMGVEGSLLSIGSAINELVQTGTSSGSFIVDFTSRMAGIAAQANLTTAEVAAFGSALDEMGQEVEVSATSMNKFVMQMFTHYKEVAKAADMDAEVLKKMLESRRTADAIVAVMEGLSKKGGLSLLAPLFKDLGSDGARLSQTLAAMSSNVDKLKSSLNTARAAFSEAKSVTNEYNIKNETTAALLERIKNAWSELFVNSKNKGIVHDFVVQLKEMSDEVLSSSTFLGMLELAIKALVLALRALVAVGPALLVMLATFKSWSIMISIHNGIRASVVALTGAYNLMKVSLIALTGAQNACSLSARRSAASFRTLMRSMKGNVIVLAISAVAGLVTYLSTLNDEVEHSVDLLNNVDKGYKNYLKDLIRAKNETDGLFRVLTSANSSEEERAAAIAKLNKEYGKYLPKLITEKDGIDAIKEAQRHLNEEMEKGMAFRMKQSALIDALDPVYKDQAEGLAKYQAAYKAENEQKGNVEGYKSFFAGYAPEVFQAAVDLRANKGMDFDTIFEEVLALAKEASGSTGTESDTFTAIAKDRMGTYIRAAIDNYQVRKRIDEVYDPHIKDYGNFDTDDTIIVEDDKEKKKKAAREETEKAKKEYEALIYKLKAFFNLQEAAVKDSYVRGEISPQTKTGYLEGLDIRRNEALMQARNRISGQANNWEDTRKSLSDIQFADPEQTRSFLDAIAKVDTEHLHEILQQFGPEFLDQIANKAAENLVKVKEAGVKVRDEVTRILLQDDYLEQNRVRFQAEFERLKLMNVDYLKESSQVAEESAQDSSLRIQGMWFNAFKLFRENYEKLFDIDIMSAEGQNQFRDYLEPLKKEFPQLAQLSEEQLRLLYSEILKLRDADLDAMRKSLVKDERRMKTGFSNTESSSDLAKKQGNQERELDSYNRVRGLGLSTENMIADGEVALYKTKLEAAQMYYEYVMEQSDNEMLKRKAQQELDAAAIALSEKMVAQVGTHLSYLKEYGDSIADFGTDFGAAIFGSLEDRQKTIENLGRAFADTTKKIIMDWIKQRMMHRVHSKLMKKEERGLQKDITKGQKEAADDRATIASAGQDVVGNIVQKGTERVAQIRKKENADSVKEEADVTQAKGAMGIAQAASKTLAELGWWGIPLVAVIEALLNGLLSAAMSKVSSLFGGGKENVVKATKSKVVSGMLTYDSGNLQEIDRYVGDDGAVYKVSQRMGRLETGIVNLPTATSVNGHPSLVGERGPELVVGRETTAALMMNNPGLIRYLINFDKQYSGRAYRAYDKGNLNEVNVDGEAIPDSRLLQTLQELSETNAALAAELKRGIRANINKFGRGGLVDEVVDGILFESENGNDPKVKRFLNRRN